MGTSPFKGARQIWEIDFGTTEENRVCGISGNPIRLGWLFHKAGVPHFADRFFLPLQPLMVEYLGEMLCELWQGGDAKKHTSSPSGPACNG